MREGERCGHSSSVEMAHSPAATHTVKQNAADARGGRHCSWTIMGGNSSPHHESWSETCMHAALSENATVYAAKPSCVCIQEVNNRGFVKRPLRPAGVTSVCLITGRLCLFPLLRGHRACGVNRQPGAKLCQDTMDDNKRTN